MGVWECCVGEEQQVLSGDRKAVFSSVSKKTHTLIYPRSYRPHLGVRKAEAEEESTKLFKNCFYVPEPYVPSGPAQGHLWLRCYITGSEEEAILLPLSPGLCGQWPQSAAVSEFPWCLSVP